MRALPVACVLFILMGACAPQQRAAPLALAAPAQLAVLAAVVQQAHLLAAGGERRAQLSAQLRPLRLGAPPDPSRPPPLPDFSVSGRELVRPGCADGHRFTPQDTLWWRAQGTAPPVRLDPVRFGPWAVLALADEAPPGPRRASARRASARRDGAGRNFYRLSQPLFSRDSLWACVHVYHVCDRLCGGGEECRLAKRGGAWQLVCREALWAE